MQSSPHLQSKHISYTICLLLILILLPQCAWAGSGKVTAESLILRKSAAKESKALQTLDEGDSLKILSISGDWYKVTVGKHTGYVMKNYVSTKDKVEETQESKRKSSNDSKKTATTVSGLGSPPASCKKGDSGSDVKKLQKALMAMGFYSGEVDGSFGEGTEDAVKAFQKRHHLSQDGIAGKVTIKLLFGEDTADNDEKVLKTERLNWFSGGESTIPKGSSFTIKDIRSGKTFTARRWSGANHLDAEPASSDDTKQMKSIFGGSWSWKRRAILVKYDGRVYAASMNGMPHGTSTIEGNGFDGHFCIHFYKSKTHETNHIDKEHQNMVDAAMKATW